MHACMHACMHGWMDGWMDGYRERETDRPTDRQDRQEEVPSTRLRPTVPAGLRVASELESPDHAISNVFKNPVVVTPGWRHVMV